jgi:membrane-associated protease RseP (regulator of RpoE activity)
MLRTALFCLSIFSLSLGAFANPIENQETYTGIGVILEKNGFHVSVKKFVPNSPAETAGIEKFDVITHIDGISTHGMGLEDVTDLIRGKSGTFVALTVERKLPPDPLMFLVQRELINLPDPQPVEVCENSESLLATRIFGDWKIDEALSNILNPGHKMAGHFRFVKDESQMVRDEFLGLSNDGTCVYALGYGLIFKVSPPGLIHNFL